MKANVHLEFSDRELEDFASRAAAKWFTRTIFETIRSVDIPPEAAQSFLQMFTQGIQFGVQNQQQAAASGSVPQASTASPVPPPSDASDAEILDWYRRHVPTSGTPVGTQAGPVDPAPEPAP